MAAYAALASLMNTMDQIQIHPLFSTSFDKKQIESLGETVGVLLDFIESYNGGEDSKEVEDLESQIAAAAHAGEDVIETHVVDQIVVGSIKGNGGMLQKMMRWVKKEPVKLHLPSVMCDLQTVMVDMDTIKECVIGRFEDRRLIIPSTLPPASSSRPVSSRKAAMVGFDDDLIHLLDKLTGQPSHQLVILPITGMGGIGKTTLARNAFENLLIKQHFDFHAWATISQNYSAKVILLEILSSHVDSKKIMALDEHQLGEQLYKFLFNRRYLIVLDDMWSVEVWDDIKFFFPENNNGCRIVVTTRLLNVAFRLNSSYHTVNLLDEDKSWNLFCQESFGKEGCTAELEEVGKKICENCKGLPLSIVVIGGHLRRSSKSREYWEGIARDTRSILNSEGDKQCLKILSSSYNHLPAHLKPCFLYMGVFAEDEVILASRLIQLWVAEGFLRPNDAQSLEEVAEVYMKDLVDRNLVFVKRWGCNGKMRACSIHDLIRELCLSLAEKDNFFCVVKSVGIPPTIDKERRIVIHESMSNQEVSRALYSASLVRSLICKGNNKSFKFRLLRLLSTVDEAPHRGFLKADLRCVNLRCLDHQFVWTANYKSLRIPTQVSLLWNLQMLRITDYSGKISAPSQLWEMVQLRHLEVDDMYVPDPPRNERVNLVLQNLQTLKYAVDFRLSEEVCKRIPNVKRLCLAYPRIRNAGSVYCPQNLGRFHKLESLTLRLDIGGYGRRMVLNMSFPTSLKKLTLLYGSLRWEDLEIIGSLPNLEVLKLKLFAMKSSEWNPVEGGFLRLKVLKITLCDLSIWNAEDFHFPVLEKLFLNDMWNLEEIPSGIGDIPTLEIISLVDCSMPCALSAVKILKEQESLGNEDLKVEVRFYQKDRVRRFREMVEEGGFTSNNLHISYKRYDYFEFSDQTTHGRGAAELRNTVLKVI